MKSKTNEILFVLFLGVLVPEILFRLAVRHVNNVPKQDTTDSASLIEQTTGSENQTLESFMLPVQMSDGSIKRMMLDDYVTCVVLAEMPAEFDEEALKAQAVVARTYALKRYRSGEKHKQGAVCTDSTCCQAYCTQEDFLARGETEASLQKVRNAVIQTHGQVLTYNGDLIEATYFSCSGGRTEDALAVWGAEIPYLKAVDSPGEEEASHYMDTVTFTIKDFSERMGLAQDSLSGNWIGSISYTPGGGVDSIRIGDRYYAGTDVRQKLGLRSTAFVITAVGNKVTVTTKGFGHRVGMSQYGADAMAVKGNTYDQILAYYYQGTLLESGI